MTGLLLTATLLAAEPKTEVVVSSEQAREPASASVTEIVVGEQVPRDAELSELVAAAPGVRVQSLGGLGSFSGVSIRGSTLRQVLVRVDGIPLNPDGAAVMSLGAWPVGSFERVEVWRGPASGSLLDTPIGGTIALHTGRDTQPFLQLTGGAWGTWRLRGVTPTVGGERIHAAAFADVLTTDADYPYYDDNGTLFSAIDDRRPRRSNQRKRMLTSVLQLGGEAGRDRWRLMDAVLVRDEGVPGPIGRTSEQAQLITYRNLLGLSASHRPGAWRVDTAGWWVARRERYTDEAGEIGVGAERTDDLLHQLGLRTEATGLVLPWLAPSLALQVRHDRYTSRDLRAHTEIPRYRTGLDAGAGLKLTHPALDLGLDVGGRLSWIDQRNLGPGDVVLATEPPRDVYLFGAPVALVWARPLPGLRWTVGLARGVRPPDLTELFGDRGATIGNPGLVPESAWTADLGVQLTAIDTPDVRVRIDGATYASWATDRIAWVRNSQLTSLPVNLDRARIFGGELALDLAALDWVDLRASVSLTDARQLSSDDAVHGKQLPGVPSVGAWTRVSLHDPWRHFRIGHTMTMTGASYFDTINRDRAAPRIFHDLFARAYLSRSGISLEVTVRNLADQIGQVVPRDPVAADGTTRVAPVVDLVGWPLPGRTVMATLHWPLGGESQ